MGPGSASGAGVSATSGHSMRPGVAVGSDGRPILAWVDGSSGVDQIYLKRFDGRKWINLGRGSSQLGGVSDTQVDSGSPSVALDRRGRPIVVWHDEIKISTRRIMIKRLERGRWRTLEGPGSDQADSKPTAQLRAAPSPAPSPGRPIPSKSTQLLPPELLEDASTTLAIKHP